MTIIIAGAGQAGAGAALALRRHGYKGRLLLAGRENHPPYERPSLSKDALLGETPVPKIVALSREAAKEQGIELLLETEIVSINRERSEVTFQPGGVYTYEKLILATGGEARILSGFVPDRQRIFCLRSIADALALRAFLQRERSIVVAGGGWLGLEIAAAARRQGHAVDLLEAGPRLCGRAAPVEVSQLLLSIHRQHGVNIHLGEALLKIESGGEGLTLRTQSGKSFRAAGLVIAAGLVPNDHLASACGLETRDGIIADPSGRTKDPNIFAIGDCARYIHPFTGFEARLESWQNANVQAGLAARAIMDLDSIHTEVPWFWSDQYGVNLQMIGATGEDLSVVERRIGPSAQSLLYHNAGMIRGAAALNAPREIGFARKLIVEGKRIDLGRAADGKIELRKLAL